MPNDVVRLEAAAMRIANETLLSDLELTTKALMDIRHKVEQTGARPTARDVAAIWRIAKRALEETCR